MSYPIYDLMRKYEFLFILSHQSKKYLHIYDLKDNPEKITLCEQISNINLCYNPGTEPKDRPTCDICLSKCYESIKESTNKEVSEQMPSIIKRKRIVSVEAKIPNDLSIEERLALTKIPMVSISDPRFPTVHMCRYICTYCKTGVDNEQQEPCLKCSRIYHDGCRERMVNEIYTCTKIRLSTKHCAFCFFFVLIHPSLRPTILTHFVTAEQL